MHRATHAIRALSEQATGKPASALRPGMEADLDRIEVCRITASNSGWHLCKSTSRQVATCALLSTEAGKELARAKEPKREV